MHVCVIVPYSSYLNFTKRVAQIIQTTSATALQVLLDQSYRLQAHGIMEDAIGRILERPIVFTQRAIWVPGTLDEVLRIYEINRKSYPITFWSNYCAGPRLSTTGTVACAGILEPDQDPPWIPHIAANQLRIRERHLRCKFTSQSEPCVWLNTWHGASNIASQLGILQTQKVPFTSIDVAY